MKSEIVSNHSSTRKQYLFVARYYGPGLEWSLSVRRPPESLAAPAMVSLSSCKETGANRVKWLKSEPSSTRRPESPCQEHWANLVSHRGAEIPHFQETLLHLLVAPFLLPASLCICVSSLMPQSYTCHHLLNDGVVFNFYSTGEHLRSCSLA